MRSFLRFTYSDEDKQGSDEDLEFNEMMGKIFDCHIKNIFLNTKYNCICERLNYT